jgi:beta-carotene ketolase (CrtW type)
MQRFPVLQSCIPERSVFTRKALFTIFVFLLHDSLSDHKYQFQFFRDTLMSCGQNFKSSLTGVWLAFGIVSAWFTSLIFLLFLDLHNLSVAELLLAILARTFFQTGLFIIGHDAMHSSLMPSNQGVNDFLGRLAVSLYAFLPYKHCRSNHFKHHRYPATLGDPDFHDGQHKHPLCWYIKFMKEYLSFIQLTALLSMWFLCYLILRNLTQSFALHCLLFWTVPLLLSSIQLFVFGTYLPHRDRTGELTNSHKAQSISYPVLLSLLTCYHFGYHWEHHEYPRVPWYALPSVRS